MTAFPNARRSEQRRLEYLAKQEDLAGLEVDATMRMIRTHLSRSFESGDALGGRDKIGRAFRSTLATKLRMACFAAPFLHARQRVLAVRASGETDYNGHDGNVAYGGSHNFRL